MVDRIILSKEAKLAEAKHRITTLEQALAEKVREVETMRLSHETWQQHSDADIAQWFHRHYESLTPLFSYETREASRVEWTDLTESMRGLMTATVTNVRLSMVAKVHASLPPPPETADDGQ